MKTTNIILAALFCIFPILLSCKSNKKAKENQTVTAIDNSRTSLDWNGIYSGVLPCADCDGTQATITLTQENTYELRIQYIGKMDPENILNGTFTWNENGSIIRLDNENLGEFPIQYQVGENTLIPLNANGSRINADNIYNLVKISDLVEKYWKLTEVNGINVTQSEENFKEPHMILKIENNRVSGNSSCNNFNGTYIVQSENNITFPRTASTMMACPNMDIESKLFQALEKTRHYSINSDKLELKDESNNVLARFEAVYM